MPDTKSHMQIRILVTLVCISVMATATAGSEESTASAAERPLSQSGYDKISGFGGPDGVSAQLKQADELRQRLLKMDQKAYVKKVQRGDKALYRVYIGPKFERAQLEAMQSGIDTAFGVKSMVARYIP